ncbi:MAG: pilus assembly protein TadE [Rothia sp. (in: high G+C Gram-positive bacteria)]|uniref:pilus assembly protein TadE n=1 Tax=Rothia sp. (in: high G+C Gram-positive bacteria) TaxID=1885016 RepID=UPI0026E08710|nr:pilus assembly protein TadE [Rothia sp. (in: high G+C Gram-positive bacteria)]MDO5750137.1 pilus assembly protein TadE [Rothia sp. (in: high G+C Gram-positive bacteria)]
MRPTHISTALACCAATLWKGALLCKDTAACKETEPAEHPEHEEGSAIVEFLALGLTLLIPVLYALLTFFSLQSSVMAAHASSAQVTQYVQAQEEGTSIDAAQAQNIGAFAAHNYGIAPENIEVQISCPQGCVKGAPVSVTTTIRAGLPLLPSALGGVIPVSSHADSY